MVEENGPSSKNGGRVTQEVEERETRVLPSGEVVTKTKVTRTYAPGGESTPVSEPELRATHPEDSGERRRAEDYRTALTITAGTPNVKPSRQEIHELVAAVRARWARDVGKPTPRLDSALPQLVQDFDAEKLYEAMLSVRGRFPSAGPDAMTAHFIRLLRDWRRQTPPTGGRDEGGSQ